MKMPTTLVRAAVLLSSCTLLVAYVAYSHVTPNSPPPDPLGLSSAEASTASNAMEQADDLRMSLFDGGASFDTAVPPAPAVRPSQEIRIISSKVINQPIFSVRKGPFSWRQPSPKKKTKARLDQFGVQLDGGFLP